jgi:ABC-type sugar transport system substrate-binding protein
MKQTSVLLRVVHLALMLVLLSGCAGAPALVSGTASGPARVAIVPPGFSSPFHIAVKDGASNEAQTLGWQLDVVAAEQEGDFSGQVAVVEQELQKGVAAIAINPIDANAIVTAVKKANKNNTPVLMENTITPVDQGEVIEYIGYNQWAGAAKLAKYTCDLFKANAILNGKVYILMGILGFHADRRTQGYEWGLRQYCPDVQVVGQQTADWDRTEAVDVATAALQQHPDINLFYGNSDEMSIGACIAAKKIGRLVNKDIWCIGIDGNPVTLDLIEKGDLTATLGVYPTLIGKTVIDQMARVLRGEKVVYILETPSVVVDKTNLVEYKSGSTWIEPVAGSPEFDNGQPTGSP